VGGALDFVQGKQAPRTEITEKKEEKERKIGGTREA
jgi:hypothetical protein